MFGQDWGKMMSNPYLDQLRQSSLADATAQTVGARRAGMNAGGNDPALAAFGGLAGLIGGQGNAARTVGLGNLQWLKGQQDVMNQKRLMRYQMMLQQQAQGNPLMGALGGIGGMALGSWLAPGGWFKGFGGQG